MAEYVIVFNDEWVGDPSEEDLDRASRDVRAVCAEMEAAGVLVVAGGLDPRDPVASVDATSGTPIVTDGPFVETKEHLGGFTVVDVADEEAARGWAMKLAVACGWPQQVHRLHTVRPAAGS